MIKTVFTLLKYYRWLIWIKPSVILQYTCNVNVMLTIINPSFIGEEEEKEHDKNKIDENTPITTSMITNRFHISL